MKKAPDNALNVRYFWMILRVFLSCARMPMCILLCCSHLHAQISDRTIVLEMMWWPNDCYCFTVARWALLFLKSVNEWWWCICLSVRLGRPFFTHLCILLLRVFLFVSMFSCFFSHSSLRRVSFRCRCIMQALLNAFPILLLISWLVSSLSFSQAKYEAPNR